MAISKRELWPATGAWLVFMASAATLTATLLTRAPILPLHQFHEYHLLGQLRDYHFFDLKVYRRAAVIMSHGRPLYATKLRHGFGFTYPPMAVLMFLALRWLPIRADETAVTIINVVLVAVIAHVALRLPRPGSDRYGAPRRVAGHRPGLIAAGWLIAALAVWVEPILTTFGYGQIDLLISACVVVDLVYGKRSRAGGIGIGLAAALKLTPLVFIPYLALTGRGRMAMRALIVFVLAAGASLVAVPGDTLTYWFGGKFMDVTRVTGARHLAGSGAANQSLRGALLRILPDTSHLTIFWVLGCLIVGGVALLLAVRAARRGDEAWGFLLTGLAGLLVCPVSWTHHWTIAVAGVIARLGARRRPAWRAVQSLAAVAFVLGSTAIWVVIRLGPGRHAGVTALWLGNLYVLTGLGLIATAAVIDLRHAAGRRARARRPLNFVQLRPGHRQPLAPTPTLVSVTPGHPGDSVRAMTTSQARAPDRQSRR